MIMETILRYEVLTALSRKRVSPVRWYVLKRPPNTRMVLSKRFTSTFLEKDNSVSTHFLASANSITERIREREGEKTKRGT